MTDVKTIETNTVPNERHGSFIRVRGARVHNLQNVDIDIPHERLTVLTGVSGSGKSSLAFDTIFAEGQRRYLDCLTTGTRSHLATLPPADVDSIDGLSPTVCVDQNVRTATKRSTLATSTEIHDFLRLLYARAGTAHCPDCGSQVGRQTVDQIVDRILQLGDRTRLMLLAPMVRDRKGAHQDVLERIERAGYVRARIDGELLDVAESPRLSSSRTHSIEAVIDRIILKEGIEPRLRDSVNAAVRESSGLCIVSVQDGARRWSDTVFSTKLVCPNCEVSFLPLEPRSFSFNSPWGACRSCDGLGIEGAAEVTDDDHAVTTFVTKPCHVCGGSRLQPFASHVTFGGLRIAEYSALSVADAAAVTADWIRDLQDNGTGPGLLKTDDLPAERREVANRSIPDVLFRLQCLKDVGVGYLALNRATRTLSGGEFQRARLAACLGTGLHGACFVLDEPTSGLHSHDTQRLIQLIGNLRDRGTVIVVEHDPDVIRAADHVVDLGPAGGAEGGRVIFSGSPEDLKHCEESETATLLSQHRGTLAPRDDFDSENASRAEPQPLIADCPTPPIRLRGASIHNLKHVDIEIPTAMMTCVTGLSGSGKSSLVINTLLPLLKATVGQHEISGVLADVRCDGIDIPESVARVVAIDQSPVSKAARSCVATVSGVWSDIRKLFAKTRVARARGFTASRFSFNSGAGRCADCKGTGTRRVEMKMLPRAIVECSTCHGSRFNRMTLTAKFQDRSVADILRMTVSEACEFFSEVVRISKVLHVFKDVGVGYLPLGQSAATFSGGESQRVRLAANLATAPGEHTVYLLDEPTTGLHAADVVRLLKVVRSLVDQGHSVIVIEHNLDVIRASDWVIDLGPGAGEGGGRVRASAASESFAAGASGATVEALREPRI